VIQVADVTLAFGKRELFKNVNIIFSWQAKRSR